MRSLLWLGIAALMLSQSGRVGSQQSTERKVFRVAGEYTSATGKCKAALTPNSMGGFLILTLTGNASKAIVQDDVTGIAWVDGGSLVFTASPVYGNPGVYVYSCGKGRVTRIVDPRNSSKAYPEGADYFELTGISNGSPHIVFFYYAPDVDEVDFSNFRSPRHLYRVDLDGRGFRKSS